MSEPTPTDDVVVVNPETLETRTVARGALDRGFLPGWEEQQPAQEVPQQPAQPAQPAVPQQPAARSASTARPSTQEQ